LGRWIKEGHKGFFFRPDLQVICHRLITNIILAGPVKVSYIARELANITEIEIQFAVLTAAAYGKTFPMIHNELKISMAIPSL
jgi:hypothetical protein